MKKINALALKLSFYFFLINGLNHCSAQIDLSLNYAPHLSFLKGNIQPEFFSIIQTNYVAKMSHAAYIQLDYSLSEKQSIFFTTGFLHSGYKIKQYSTISGIPQERASRALIYSYNYLTFSVGNSIQFKSFFLAPEVGLGFLVNASFKSKERSPFFSARCREDAILIDKVRLSSLPITLTIGKKIEIKNYHLTAGIKSYYNSYTLFGYNEIIAGTLGFGLMMGFPLN